MLKQVFSKERRLKVLYLIPSFTGGGAERQLAYLASKLSKNGVEVHLGVIYAGVNEKFLNGSNVVLHKILCKGNHDPFIFFRIYKLIKKIQPDVVHTWLLQMDVFGGIAAKVKGVPWCLSERSSAKRYEDLTSWKIKLRTYTGRFASAVVSNSEGGLAYWKSRNNSNLNRVIRNIIPFGFIERKKKEIIEGKTFDIGTDRLIVIAGRYSEEKNLFNLVAALNNVMMVHSDVTAAMFGEGPLFDEVRTRAAAQPCSGRISVLPYTENLYYWLNKAVGYVSVSKVEGNPNTVLEAIATGCPVVVSDIPAHREILDEDCAIFVDHESVESIANGILSLVEDIAQSKPKKNTAYLKVQDYRSERIASQYEDLYLELAEGK